MTGKENDMADYLFLFRGGDAARGKLTPEQMEQHMKKWMAWIEELSKAGQFKAGEPLAPEGRVLTGRKQVMTDGPFAEAKDMVGGYLIVTASTLAKAGDLAKGCPIFETNGSVEIRPIREMKH
jgi:hypothetical protein